MTSQPKQWTATAASMQLPPSPEFGSLTMPTSMPPPLMEEEQDRFRSVAQYCSFVPQTMATTKSVVVDLEDGATHQKQHKKHPCMTALAGPHGIVVFETNKPHKPCMVLRHEVSSASQDTTSWTALQFQPYAASESNNNSLLLAGARGSGIFVWDVCGSTLSPLFGRLGPTTRSTDNNSTDRIVMDLCWKPPITNINSLASCTSNSGALWDLRSPAIHTHSRPSLRFGTNRSSLSPSYMQVCCNDGDEIALLDMGGTVSIYDVRMARPTTSCTFSAHSHAGVGLSWMAQNNETNETITDRKTGYWVTWGLDDDLTTVKLWEPRSEICTPATDSDSYWFMDGSSERSSPSSRPKINTSTPGYSTVARLTMDGLSCARVCPEPVQGGIVTVCSPSNHPNNSASFKADLWKVEPRRNNTDSQGGNEKDEAKLADDQGGQGNGDVDYGFTKTASFGIDDQNDSLLQSIVGKLQKKHDGVGPIRAAELAVIPAAKKDQMSELVLCCLTEHGYISSYTVPEAAELMRGHGKKVDKSLTLPSLHKETSPARRSLKMVRLPPDAGGIAAPLPLFRGIYNPDSNTAVTVTEDAASALFNWTESKDTPREGKSMMTPMSPQDQQQLLEQTATAGIAPPPFSRPDGDDAITRLTRGVEGGIMQFDMDISVGYGSGDDETHQVPGTAENPSPSKDANDDVDQMLDIIAPTASLLAKRRAQAEQVPCPRLCGAVFGNGGLVCFHNGEVRKMWSWYDQQHQSKTKPRQPTHQKRSQNVFTNEAESDTNLHGSGLEHGVEPGLSVHQEINIGLSGTGDAVDTVQECPRTLQELLSMTNAAKEAQWGDDSDGSRGRNMDDSEGSVEDLFEDDESFAGSNSSDSEDFLIVGKKSDKKEDLVDLYDDYFGDMRRPVAVPLSPGGSSAGGNAGSPSNPATSTTGSKLSRKYRDSSAGAGPFDLLAPVVWVSHEHDEVALNGQCPELAEAWTLGDFTAEKGLLWDMVSSVSENDEEASGIAWGRDSCHHSDASYRVFFPQAPLPGAFATEKTIAEQPISQVRSDNALQGKDPTSDGGSNEVSNALNPGEMTVRGGEAGVRPNRQESMVFLRKLFTYQKAGNVIYPTLMSLPDAPMLPKGVTASNVKRSKSSHAILQTFPVAPSVVVTEGGDRERAGTVSSVSPRKFGVYTDNFSYRRRLTIGVERSLLRTMEICLENANICNGLGQADKANVWSLLAQMVNNVTEKDIDEFNGWGSGGALGQEFIGSVLKHYEVRGDVQMLASIVCVLGLESSLLPSWQNEKYDAYIRGYADLLYRWRLLNIRTEINKHLNRGLPEPKQRMSSDKSTVFDRENRFSCTVSCSRCGGKADPKSNVCPSCKDYAFRCSICTNAVRGLFTFCILCGHGGHVEHVVPWFENHSACPSGCGCICLLNTLPSQPLLDNVRGQLLHSHGGNGADVSPEPHTFEASLRLSPFGT